MKNAVPFLLVVVGLLSACTPATLEPSVIVPHAPVTPLPGAAVSLADGFSINVAHTDLQPLAAIFADDVYLLTGLRNADTPQAQPIHLALNADLAPEAYTLRIDDTIRIEGGSYGAVSMGLVSLMQLMNDDLDVPRLTLEDRPHASYRSVMLDIARGWHDMGVLKEVIALCKWYKINYLHLHLTDDQSFTFPSTAYPQLATEGRSFDLTELKALNDYAYQHGVTLVPEIDVPGHATQFVRKMPELFGIGDPSKNSYTISMGKEAVYDALDTLIGEIADVFTYSPYIHIGGDEAFFVGMDEDPDTQAYMAKHELPNLNELFRHFLVRLNDMVRSYGKQTIVWAGFSEKGDIDIPRNVIVMLWESQYYDPQNLIDQGFPVINASFKPLYVVNNRKWDPAYIYTQWNPNRWESWTNTGDTFVGIEVSENDHILGATMCAWEQNQINQVLRLRKRVPAMSEHLWHPDVQAYPGFQQRLTQSDQKLSKLLRPFEVKTQGNTYPDMAEGNFYEHLWFNTSLSLTVQPTFDSLTLRYTLDGNPVTPDAPVLNDALRLDATTTVKIQAFDTGNQPVGFPFHQRYFLRPITVSTENLWKDLPSGSWEKHRFEGNMTLALETTFADHAIKYTLDGTRPTGSSPSYTAPIQIDQTTRVRAQLITSVGTPVGSEFSEIYYHILNEPSLTTNKPIRASNERIRPGLARLANNGRVTLWEQWGGHVGDSVWLEVDLEQPERISTLKVYNFWDTYRYYQYTIDGSVDGKTWTPLVDFSSNTETASREGYSHTIEPTTTRYLRLNLLYNSANPGLHVVEFNAFP